MSTEAICNITVLALDNWAEPVAWPQNHRFYAACVIDEASRKVCDGGMDPYELMGVAMAAGARSVFWWGTGKKEDDMLHMTIAGSDSSVFTYAYRVAMGEMKKDDDMLLYPCSDTNAAMAVDDMLSTVDEHCKKYGVDAELIVVGLKGSLSMKKFRRDMLRAEKEQFMTRYVYALQNKIRGKSYTIEANDQE